jgi:hypothetical protein
MLSLNVDRAAKREKSAFDEEKLFNFLQFARVPGHLPFDDFDEDA